jgi:cell division septum initiation protein DivIVA
VIPILAGLWALVGVLALVWLVWSGRLGPSRTRQRFERRGSITPSPEEIRHVSISSRLGGYDRRETDQLLSEIADSFELVWHQRSDLYDEVKRLQVEVQDADRRQQVQSAETAGLQARLKYREVTIAKLREEVERMEADRGALFADSERARTELARERAQMAEKSKRLSEFLANVLEEVERTANGSASVRDLDGLQEELRDTLRDSE